MTSKKAYEQRITNTIQNLEAKIPKKKTAGWTAAWQLACVKLVRIEQNQSNLARLQAATSLDIKGKQPTKAFIAMYKTRSAQKTLSEVMDKGTSYTSKEGALSTTHAFYSALYASEMEPNPAALRKWLEVVLATPEMKDIDLLIEMEELEAAIHMAPKQKAPKPNGLPYEFYQHISPYSKQFFWMYLTWPSEMDLPSQVMAMA
ncbi:hypothetical protein DSO57_1003417 [Entomophthora muscae]|uniref:Uncharacterized protein n=1 Tax=Entomophthora muscae TaxID=34485 RepID=A0ACC2TJP4_9FUNG|nr:hypothetical protein DSO57_1003417 [Entomophthora muscae]